MGEIFRGGDMQMVPVVEPGAAGAANVELNDRICNAEIRIEAAQLEIQSLRSEDAVAPKIKVLVQQLSELAPLVIQHENALKELRGNTAHHSPVLAENRTTNIPAAMEVKPEIVRPPAFSQ